MKELYLKYKSFWLAIGIPLLTLLGYFTIGLSVGDESSRFNAQLIFTRSMIFVFLLCAILPLRPTISIIKGFLNHSSSSFNLSMFRILFFAISGGVGAPLVIFFGFKPLEPWGDLTAAREPLPFMNWFIQNIHISEASINFFFPLTMVAAFFAMIGLGTRFWSIVYTLGAFYVIGIPNYFGKVNMDHHMVWFALILALSPTNHRFSIDNWIRKKRNKPPRPNIEKLEYGLPLRLIWILFGVIYFFPGFWKMWDCGLDWALTDNIKNHLHLRWAALETFSPLFRIDRYPLLYKLSGLFTLYFEFGFIFFILEKPWRHFAVASGFSFHRFTSWFMNIQFAVLWLSYAVFIDWERLNNWIKTKRGKQIETATREKPGPMNLTSKIILGAGGLLIISNILFGIGGVVSWPLTCYPTFAYLVPGYYENLDFTLVLKDGTEEKIEEDKMKAIMTLERYNYWEDRVIEYKQNGDRTKEIYWLEKLTDLWIENSSDEIEIEGIRVYLVKYGYDTESDSFGMIVLEKEQIYEKEI